MKILLGKEEALEMIHSALCNGGLIELRMCGIELNVMDEDYIQAKAELKAQDSEKSLCREDVWAQILRGGKTLDFFDHEGEEAVSFTLEQAIENMSKEDVADILMTYKNEEDDAWTAFELLQHCLYGEVIYG